MGIWPKIGLDGLDDWLRFGYLCTPDGAFKKRSTEFVKDLLHNQDGATVSRIIQRCKQAEYRLWLHCMLDIYPVQAYLKPIGQVKS